jgi:hypothetical protein
MFLAMGRKGLRCLINFPVVESYDTVCHIVVAVIVGNNEDSLSAGTFPSLNSSARIRFISAHTAIIG